MPFVAFSQNEQTIVFLRYTGAQTASREAADQLKKKVESLSKNGAHIVLGYFQTKGAVLLIRQMGVEEAKDRLDIEIGEPAELWSIEIAPFNHRWGTVCPVSSPVELLRYTFIRFDAITAKYTASTFPQIIRQHDLYIKQLIETGNVVAEGTFGDTDGGILIMKGDVQREVFENDPGVTEGLLEFSIQWLDVARGSFCEN